MIEIQAFLLNFEIVVVVDPPFFPIYMSSLVKSFEQIKMSICQCDVTHSGFHFKGISGHMEVELGAVNLHLSDVDLPVIGFWSSIRGNCIIQKYRQVSILENDIVYIDVFFCQIYAMGL